ncbi:MAG: hypothetical protein IPM36_20815 [Lewinellaceae bacterium]|nr:hypothetical protein [Lewinellaceae bacterium]
MIHFWVYTADVPLSDPVYTPGAEIGFQHRRRAGNAFAHQFPSSIENLHVSTDQQFIYAQQ